MIPVLLILILAVGAVADPQQSPKARPNSSASSSSGDLQPVKPVKAEDPVITITGICKDSSARSGNAPDCKTIVTKEQFDRLVAAAAVGGQPVPSSTRQQLAQAYVDLLAYEEAARPSGTESSPEFRDLMDLIRLRTLAEIHRRNLQAKYRTPSPQDISDYYRQNLLSYTDMKLHRILIPRKNPAAESQEEYEKRALQVANDLRERAAKGEDPDQLQKEGYAALGLAAPPGTDMGTRRKANILPENRDEIMALNAGGLSKVEHEAYSFVIYKVDSKNLLPEEAVKDEITREISRQRLENAIKDITSSVHPEFNKQYFTPAPPALPANSSATAPGGPQ